MTKIQIALAAIAFSAACTAPSFAQNQATNPSDQEQMSQNTQSDNGGATAPHHGKKKRKPHSNSGASDSSNAKPGNSNQTNVPTTQPGSSGSQSGANPAGSPGQK